MSNKFKIELHLLQRDAVYKFEENVSFTDLDINQEAELKFTKPIHMFGKAYLVDETLIMVVNIKFFVLLPCSICNELFEKEFIINNLHITEKILNINSTYDYKEEIRNACFLEIPSYVQCSEKCPKKDNVKKYLNITKKNYPFSNLKEL